MLLLIGVWVLMAAAAVFCGMKLSLPAALGTWAALAAGLCVAGAILLHLQPIGISTASGRVGGSLVHWGFRVGQGELIPAVGISWLVWTLAGVAIIALTQYRSQPRHMLMVLAWTVDVAALLYVVGVLATHRGSRVPGSLLLVAASLLAMIVSSASLWWYVGTDRSRTTALAVAGGPPLVIGLGYGLFVAVTLVAGGRARWN